MEAEQISIKPKKRNQFIPQYFLPDFSLVSLPNIVYTEQFFKKIYDDGIKQIPNEAPVNGQLSTLISALNNHNDTLDYVDIFTQFNKIIIGFGAIGNSHLSEIHSVIKFITILNNNIESIPTEALPILITSLLHLLDHLERQVPAVPSLSKISKPLQIIPRLTNQRRRSSPRPLPSVRASQYIPNSKCSPLLNFGPTIQLISFFIARVSIYLSGTLDGIRTAIKFNMHSFLIKMLGSPIATLSRATAAAALCKLSLNSEFRSMLINYPDSQPTIIGSLISDEEDDRTPDFAQLSVYILALIDILTLDPMFSQKYDITLISKDFVRTTRVFPMHKTVVLSAFYFLNLYSNDSIVRGALIEEFGVEIIVALFIQLITIYKSSPLIAPLVCSVLTTFFLNEFDVASEIAVISDPVSITAIADIVSEITDPSISAAIVRLIAVLATDASCAAALAPSLECLTEDLKVFSDPQVLQFIVPAIHNLMLNASFMPPNVCIRISEWLSMHIEESLIQSVVTFSADYFERAPNSNTKEGDVLQSMMTLISDSNLIIAESALETVMLLCEKGYTDILSDPRTESRLEKATQQYESDSNVMKLISQLKSKIQ